MADAPTELELGNIETYGPAMLACTALERRFAFALGSGVAESYAEAARLAGYSDKSEACKVRANACMQRERVRAAIREVAGSQLETLAGLAIRAMRDALLDRRHPERFKAASTILSRLGFGENHNVNVLARVEVQDHTKAALDDLRSCIALGIPEDKLIELFGYSGLSRYRAMLEAEGAKSAPKLIESTAAEKLMAYVAFA